MSWLTDAARHPRVAAALREVARALFAAFLAGVGLQQLAAAPAPAQLHGTVSCASSCNKATPQP